MWYANTRPVSTCHIFVCVYGRDRDIEWRDRQLTVHNMLLKVPTVPVTGTLKQVFLFTTITPKQFGSKYP